MKTVNIHEAKTNLSRFIEDAVDTLPMLQANLIDRILITQASAEGMVLRATDKKVAPRNGPSRLV